MRQSTQHRLHQLEVVANLAVSLLDNSTSQSSWPQCGHRHIYPPKATKSAMLVPDQVLPFPDHVFNVAHGGAVTS
jgi:hypothetical protein